MDCDQKTKRLFVDRRGEAMSRCQFQNRCPYFNNTIAMPLGSWEKLTNAYCLSENRRCARFLVYHEFEQGSIPLDLRPDQHGRAHELLSCVFYS
jgi:hypothetical protein